MPPNSVKNGGGLHGRNKSGKFWQRFWPSSNQRAQQTEHHRFDRMLVRSQALGHGRELRAGLNVIQIFVKNINKIYLEDKKDKLMIINKIYRNQE